MINWTGWKTVKLILGIFVTAAGAVAASNQGTITGQVASVVGSVAGGLLSGVVILSGTSVGPTVQRAAK